MANTPEQVVATLTSMPAYVDSFKAAFPDEAEPVSFDNMAKAIEAFEATLITPAPFDAYLNGDDAALSDTAKAGMALFIDKGCSSCHSGVNVGGHGYYPFGLIEKPGSEILPEGDKGRFAVTETADDEYVFRASPLRNIALTAPYFHSGKVWDLKVAVQIMAESQLGEELSDDEANQIVAFLDSLTGTLPEITVPVLPAETATTPRPTAEVK
jgi:cytochrome c peroxidase